MVTGGAGRRDLRQVSRELVVVQGSSLSSYRVAVGNRIPCACVCPWVPGMLLDRLVFISYLITEESLVGKLSVGTVPVMLHTL